MGSLIAEYSDLFFNPSTSDDQQVIEQLRLIKAGQGVEPDLTKLQPSDLPPSFPLSSKYVPGTREKAWETQHGSWKLKGGSFSGVTIGAVGLNKHVVAKRTMEFYQNGTATDWVMDQYFVLAVEIIGLLMEDDVTLCHVYQQKRKGPLNDKVYSPPKEGYCGKFVPEDYDPADGLLPSRYQFGSPLLDMCLNRPNQHQPRLDEILNSPNQQFYQPPLYEVLNIQNQQWQPRLDEILNSQYQQFYQPRLDEVFNSLNQQAANNQEAVLPKTKRKSDVWNDFTKVYVKDPGGKLKLEYAMCNSCHMLLRAPSSNGTKSLWSHTGTCRCKRLQQQTE